MVPNAWGNVITLTKSKFAFLEFSVLDSWWQWLDANMGLDLDMIVYLRTTPEVAYQRMKARGRWEEEGAPFSYLKALHQVSGIT